MIRENNIPVHSYIVEVKNGAGKKKRTYLYRKQLKSVGVTYTSKGKKWTGSFPCNEEGRKEEIQIRRFCKRYGLKYIVKNTEYARDVVYRERFF